MSRLSRQLTLLLAAPFVMTACGGSTHHEAAATASGPAVVNAAKSADGIQQVTIDTTDNFRFVPATINAHVGKLRIVLTDNGSYPHNISFPDMHATSSTVSGDPGQDKTTFTVTFSHAGTYDFVCTFHSSAGMKGRVEVS